MQLQRELLPNFKTANEDWTQKVSSMVENVHTAPSYSFAAYCEAKEAKNRKNYLDEEFNLSECRSEIFGPHTGCKECEGTGWLAISKACPDPKLRSLWAQAEEDTPTDDGWHLVPCPGCGPGISEELDEHIVKKGSQFELKSKKSGKNLGTYSSKAGAKKREAQVEYFKHLKEEKLNQEKSVHQQWMPEEFGSLTDPQPPRYLPWKLHEDWPLPGHPPDTGHSDYKSPQKNKGVYDPNVSEAIGPVKKEQETEPHKKHDPNASEAQRKEKARQARQEKERLRQTKKLLPYEFTDQKDAERSAGHLGIHGAHTTGNGIYKPGSSDYSLRDAVAKKKSKQRMRGKLKEEKQDTKNAGLYADPVRGDPTDPYPLDKSNCHEDRDYMWPENPKTSGEKLPEGTLEKIKECVAWKNF